MEFWLSRSASGHHMRGLGFHLSKNASNVMSVPGGSTTNALRVIENIVI